MVMMLEISIKSIAIIWLCTFAGSALLAFLAPNKFAAYARLSILLR